MSTFLQDVRYGGRQLLRRKGSSLLAILTLALGVGASAAIFSVVDSTMLRPLPYPNPEQLVSLAITEPRPNGKTSTVGPSMDDLLFLRQATDLFSFVEGFGSAFNGHIAGGAEPERLDTVHFTEGYLAMHGVRPLIGRDFTAADTTRGAPLVALLGYGYWQSRLAGRDVIGETIRLNDEVATIIGVLPRTFNPNTPVSLPLVMSANEMGRRGSGSRLGVVARLQPGVSIDAA
ncbi:MAG TPA: ABC transporter permease, partial [Vicinamibacterales bacterium]|nr:ABC transporter permease [Vicinamibacterales bacterium]